MPHVHAYTIPGLAPAYHCACGQRAERIISGPNRGRWCKLVAESSRWPENEESFNYRPPSTTPAVDAVLKGYRNPI